MQNQKPRSATSDLGLHCLSMSLLYRKLGINGLLSILLYVYMPETGVLKVVGEYHT